MTRFLTAFLLLAASAFRRFGRTRLAGPAGEDHRAVRRRRLGRYARPVVAEHLSATFKQQFVVENRTGAGGAIGAAAIASAAPDGYTIGITNLSILALVPAINLRELPPGQRLHAYRLCRRCARGARCHAVVGHQDTQGIYRHRKQERQGEQQAPDLRSSGVGSDGHLMGVAIGLATNVQLEHVPYRSTSQALTDVVAGHVALCTFTLSSTAQFLRGGQLNGVAVTSPDRMPDQPELPTVQGARLSAACRHHMVFAVRTGEASGRDRRQAQRRGRRIVALPDVQARFRRDGFIAQPMSPAEFTKYVGDEAARWKPLVEKAGLAGKGG